MQWLQLSIIFAFLPLFVSNIIKKTCWIKMIVYIFNENHRDAGKKCSLIYQQEYRYLVKVTARVRGMQKCISCHIIHYISPWVHAYSLDRIHGFECKNACPVIQHSGCNVLLQTFAENTCTTEVSWIPSWTHQISSLNELNIVTLTWQPSKIWEFKP